MMRPGRYFLTEKTVESDEHKLRHVPIHLPLAEDAEPLENIVIWTIKSLLKMLKTHEFCRATALRIVSKARMQQIIPKMNT